MSEFSDRPSQPQESDLLHEVQRLRAQLAESERARAMLSSLQESLAEAAPPPDMVGGSGVLSLVRERIRRLAPSDTTVLIHGETGTGKELVARSIHAESPRARRAFVAVNCAAIPESLLESELFGHERGAFTGADRRRLGKFELAHSGSLFLDEIGELTLPAQAKLLRVLQDGSFQRVGGTETVTVDVRVIAATHRDLARLVERGQFREDLYYRLHVLRIEVPPLRERREDIRELIEAFHRAAARRLARPVLPISEASMRRAMAYRWPGNIRELSNAVERATLLADGPELELELPDAPTSTPNNRDYPHPGSMHDRQAGHRRQPSAPRSSVGFATGTSTDGTQRGAGGGTAAASGGGGTRDILLDLTLEQLQRLQIMHALETCGYRVFGPGGAAERLDVHPNTLLSRMDKFGIPRPRQIRSARSTP